MHQQAPPAKVYSISELTQRIRGTLEHDFSNIWIEGEVSNLRMPPSGHLYFTLKDKSSQLKIILFKNRRRYLKFQLKDGLQILAKGNINVYEKRGEYQLIAEYAEPKGIGALQLAFEQLKQRLAKEGFFDESHKKKLPLLPRCIGLVTSPTGAAIRDILNVIYRRFPNVRVLINPVRVQGDEAAGEIAAAIDEFNRLDEHVDIIITGRGGGSLEDLWCFNEEIVARSVYNSKIPIISAVGHEIDFTICDFAADLRAPPPSAAAELVVKNKDALIENLDNLEIRLSKGIKYILDTCKNRHQSISQKSVFSDPLRIIREYQQQTDDLSEGLKNKTENLFQELRHRFNYAEQKLQAYQPTKNIINYKQQQDELFKKLKLVMGYCLDRYKNSLSLQMGRLDVLSPLSILKRGYSICQHLPDNEILTDAQKIKLKDSVSIKLYQGSLTCRVENIEND